VRDDSGATEGLDVPIFYDPMISKLIAWAEDRPQAIARMRRALGEFVIAGIRTTLPFFTWLMAQPDFESGRFHTTYLDEALASRNGRPFVEPGPQTEELAAIAAALDAALPSSNRNHAGNGAGPQSGRASVDTWKVRARAEGLRDL
jgi:acetyl/propionyl-CoA carboxylase alpha subunit